MCHQIKTNSWKNENKIKNKTQIIQITKYEIIQRTKTGKNKTGYGIDKDVTITG